MLSLFALTSLFFSISTSQPTKPVPSDALSLPRVIQQTDYSCGPAALSSVLRYWNVFSGEEKELYGPLKTTPEHGTHPRNIVEVTRSFGLVAEMKENLTVDDLKAALSLNSTVIIDLQAWTNIPNVDWEKDWEDGHYVVLAGLSDKDAFFMDPSARGRYAYIPLTELPKRWHDYEIVDGVTWQNQHLGIMIQGKESIPFVPHPAGLPAIRME